MSEYQRVRTDQWERIAAVVRAIVCDTTGSMSLVEAVDALTPDDIEAVQS